MKNTNPTVSIIIPTYNNQDTIALCLESIEQQAFEQTETIVVDGGSSDLTPDICRSYSVELIETDLGRSAARTKGARVASGDYLLHVDSDMELTPNVVKECVNLSERFDALIIPETNIGDTYWARCTDVGKSVAQQGQIGNLRFLSKELYFKSGGHNSKLLGKEDEELHNMVRKNGGTIGHTNNLIHHHVGPLQLYNILTQRWRYMRSLSAYKKHSRIKESDINQVPKKSKAISILSELSQRPLVVFGFLILEVLTMSMAILNKATLATENY